MNEKFFALPPAKQQAILDAGYRVFARSSYKKAPMQQIADAAGVSKSLLFHYFRNKKELYLFLWQRAAQTTAEELHRRGCYEQKDLAAMLSLGMQVKLELMRRRPDMGAFAMRAFYESDPAVRGEIQQSCAEYIERESMPLVLGLPQVQFLPGIDPRMAYREMYWAAAGYVWELQQRGEFDWDEVRATFRQMVDFWRAAFLSTPKEG